MMEHEKPGSVKWKILVRILAIDLSAVFLPSVLATMLACFFGDSPFPPGPLVFAFFWPIMTPLMVSGLCPEDAGLLLFVSVFVIYVVGAVTAHLVLYRRWPRSAAWILVPILLLLVSCFAALPILWTVPLVPK